LLGPKVQTPLQVVHVSKISVVVPSYNHAEYIGTCLDSIYFQDHPDLEIIIVDDCSTDDSVAVIADWLRAVREDEASFVSGYNAADDALERCVHARYNKPGREIRFLRNSSNRGATWTYNRGFREATGALCTFVVSDDICHPQLFSTLAEPLDRDEADFAYADMFIVDDAHRVLREFKLPDYGFEASFCQWYLCGVAKLYKRELHERFGFYDESAMADDHECFLRFAMNGARFLHVPRTLYSVRSHDGRQVGLHSKQRFTALLNHSKELVLKARAWAQTGSPKG